jgi:hypothetical protein
MTTLSRGNVYPGSHFTNLRATVHDFLIGRVNASGEAELVVQAKDQEEGQIVFLADTGVDLWYVTPVGVDYLVIEYVNCVTPMVMYFDQAFRNKVQDQQILLCPLNYTLNAVNYRQVYFAKGPAFDPSRHCAVYLTERNEQHPHTHRFWDDPVLDGNYLRVVDGYQHHLDIKFSVDRPAWYDRAAVLVTTSKPEPCAIDQHLAEINQLDQQISAMETTIEALINQLESNLNINYSNDPVQIGESSCGQLYHQLITLKTEKLNLMSEKEALFRQCNNDVIAQMGHYEDEQNRLANQIDQINHYQSQYVNSLEQLRAICDDKLKEFNSTINNNTNSLAVVDQYQNYLNQLEHLYLGDLDRLNRILQGGSR